MKELKQLIENSNKFLKLIGRTKYPVPENTIEYLTHKNIKPEQIINKANQTYPIMHAAIPQLIMAFLDYAKTKGTDQEKKLYQDMNVEQFIDRLLQKRPLVFMNLEDRYVLRNGDDGFGGFDEIGTPGEKSPLVLDNYLSYAEMQISALLGVSTDTFFINKGNRNNKGLVDESGNFEQQGIYTGLVGARFEKKGYMEWQHMVISAEQNTNSNGYGKKADQHNPKTRLLSLWAKFYSQGKQDYFPTYQEALADKNKYIQIKGDLLLNVDVYKRRLRLVIEPFLLDANERAKKSHQQAYVHAEGLGLGYWKLNADIQAKLMVEVYNEIIADQQFTNISDIDFSYFPDSCANVKSSNPKIKMHFSQNNPADKLVDENKGKLLVAMYAWDGNAFPGNEYWIGMLSASGDPAAASCSMISQLQNPYINPAVSAVNVRRYSVNNNEEKTEVKSVKSETLQSKFFINSDDLKMAEVKNLKLAKPDPIKVKNLSQSIGATASLLIAGYLSRDEAVKGINIANIDYTKDHKMILKFPNAKYAQNLTYLLKENFGKQIEYKSIDETNGFGHYKGAITISGLNAIKKFIENVCGFHDSYTANLFDIKFGIKPEAYKAQEPPSCMIS